MKINKLIMIVCSLLFTAAVSADELHDKAMSTTYDLQHAIEEMRVIQEQHGGDFGGHMERAINLARQAEQERDLALRYYRAHNPGWQ